MKTDWDELVKPLLMNCRPGDYQHGLRVVKWVEELSRGNPNSVRLIKAAYLHDLGWYGLVETNQKLTKDELKRLEPQANDQSEKIITDFLKKQGEADNEIAEILKLVKATDAHESHNDDEAIMVDADNLSKLNLDHVAEKYQQSDWQKMLTLWKDEFPKRIQTDIGKQIYPELINKLEKDIRSNMQFSDLYQKTLDLCKKFPDQFDKRDTLIHLMEAVGELSETMLLVEGRKHSNRGDKQMTVDDIAKRLSAILMYVFMLQDKYGIDLEAAHVKLLEKMETRIKAGEFN